MRIGQGIKQAFTRAKAALFGEKKAQVQTTTTLPVPVRKLTWLESLLARRGMAAPFGCFGTSPRRSGRNKSAEQTLRALRRRGGVKVV